mmetsp:Transcript_2298/g.3334  ORF Transcript_2298/g.3334 Transcript_2298/m.3334 type:complete len:120 (-) Transcript_2298:937-1296(-)
MTFYIQTNLTLSTILLFLKESLLSCVASEHMYSQVNFHHTTFFMFEKKSHVENDTLVSVARCHCTCSFMRNQFMGFGRSSCVVNLKDLSLHTNNCTILNQGASSTIFTFSEGMFLEFLA